MRSIAVSALLDAPHVLIMDTTLAVCDRDPRVFVTPLEAVWDPTSPPGRRAQAQWRSRTGTGAARLEQTGDGRWSVGDEVMRV